MLRIHQMISNLQTPGQTPRTIRKRHSINNGQRKALRDKARTLPRGRQKELNEWFQENYGHSPSQSTISESLSKRYDWLDGPNAVVDVDAVKLRPSHWPELEAALIRWYREKEGPGPPTHAMIVAQAAIMWDQLEAYRGRALPQFSNGWVDGFKRRNGLKMRRSRPSQPLSSRIYCGGLSDFDPEVQMEVASDLHLNSEVGPSLSTDHAVVSTIQCSLDHINDQSVPRQPSDNAMNSRPGLSEDHEIGEELESTHRVSVKEALQALKTLRRFEEQAHNKQPDLIQRLNEHEKELRKKEPGIVRQESLAASFAQHS